MATVDRDILTIVEPTIKVDEVFVEDEQSPEAQEKSTVEQIEPTVQQQTVEGGLYPMVQIGTNKVSMDDLVSMELKNDSFIPTATFVVQDVGEKLSQKSYPLDGDVVSLYLKPRPIETYRPIRIDFDIMSIQSAPSVVGDDPQPALYTFQCIMRVPLLFADVIQGFAEGNSYDHLLECAEGLGLGFASNDDGTEDPMVRIVADQGRDEWITQTTLSAYKNDDSFFTSYIDLQYYLCMVNVNKQFSFVDEMEEVPVEPKVDQQLQQEGVGGEDTGGITGSLRLSNEQDVQGTDMYISKYNLINNAGDIWRTNGYKRKVKYLNLNENNNDGENGGLEEFLITPLNTPGAESDRIPLRGRIDDPTWEDNNKCKYLGKQPSEEFTNVHSNYMYAIASNFGNMDEIEKLSMEVDIETVNWSLYRFQRVPILIYSKGTVTSMDLENRDRQLGEDEQPKNNPDAKDEDVNYDEPSQQVKNEFLSGWYVISGITYKYTTGAPITQTVKLLRREWPIPTRNKDN